jgi:hypothetical protein
MPVMLFQKEGTPSVCGRVSSSDENPLKFNSSAHGSIIAHFKPTLSYEQYVFIIGGVTAISSVLLGWFLMEGKEENSTSLSGLLIKLYKFTILGARRRP